MIDPDSDCLSEDEENTEWTWIDDGDWIDQTNTGVISD